MGWSTALSLLLALAPPPATPPVPPRAETPPVAATDTAAPPTSTAVALVPVDTRMAVKVMINGAGPFRFIVDSGASRTVISSSLAKLLNLPSTGKVEIHSVGGASIVDSARIDHLMLGYLPAGPIIAPVLEESNLGAAGILGIDVLADKRVVLDFVHDRMDIEASSARRPRYDPDEIVVTARRRFGELVLVNADIHDQHIYAIVDTGSEVTIGNEMLRSKLLRKGIALQSLLIHDVTGRQVPAVYAAAGDIRIASIKIANIIAAFCDADAFDRFQLRDKPAMLLGMDLLQAFRRVEIDFARKTVRLLPTKADDPLPFVR